MWSLVGNKCSRVETNRREFKINWQYNKVVNEVGRETFHTLVCKLTNTIWNIYWEEYDVWLEWHVTSFILTCYRVMYLPITLYSSKEKNLVPSVIHRSRKQHHFCSKGTILPLVLKKTLPHGLKTIVLRRPPIWEADNSNI